MAKIISFKDKLQEKIKSREKELKQTKRQKQALENDWIFKTSSFLVCKLVNKELTYQQAQNLAKFLFDRMPISNSKEIEKYNEPLKSIDEYAQKNKYPPLKTCPEIENQITMLKKAIFKKIFPLPLGARILKLCTDLYNLKL